MTDFSRASVIGWWGRTPAIEQGIGIEKKFWESLQSSSLLQPTYGWFVKSAVPSRTTVPLGRGLAFLSSAPLLVSEGFSVQTP